MKKISRKRLLTVIEGLCELWENTCKTLEQAQEIVDDIYKVSHLGSNCENPHEDWVKDFIKLERELKNHKVI